MSSAPDAFRMPQDVVSGQGFREIGIGSIDHIPLGVRSRSLEAIRRIVLMAKVRLVRRVVLSGAGRHLRRLD